MKTTDDIIHSLAHRIGRIYYHPRPLVYAGTAQELDRLLYLYHELWSEIVERENDFRHQQSNSLGFAIPYADEHPEATEEQIAQEVVRQWSAISGRLEVPLPHESLTREFLNT
jgi:hypothetical protein